MSQGLPCVMVIGGIPYTIFQILSESDSGYVYRAHVFQLATYIIKTEVTSKKPSSLAHEWDVYQHLGGMEGVAKPVRFGELGGYRYLVMPAAGPSIQATFSESNFSFPLRQVFEFAISLINILEQLHARGVVHRDVKPSNIICARQRLFQIQPIDITHIALIDFGIAAFKESRLIQSTI